MKIFLIIGLFLIVSQVGAAQVQPLTVQRGALKFASIADYESYADNTLDRDNIRDLYLSADDLTTMEEAGQNPQREDDSLYPEFLLAVLNQDRIVGIANFLVKIDMEHDRALVIDESAPDAYELLVNNAVNAPGMMVFSRNEENALEILEEIQANRLSARNYRDLSSENAQARACGGAAGRERKALPLWDTRIDKAITDCNNLTWEYRMDTKLVYQKFIFYFSLQSKMRSVRGCTYSNWVLVPYHVANLSLSGKVKYRKRCNDEVREANVIPSYINSVIHWRPYEASRSLSHYDFSVKFGIKHTWSTGAPFETELYRISSGY